MMKDGLPIVILYLPSISYSGYKVSIKLGAHQGSSPLLAPLIFRNLPSPILTFSLL